jgi:hypothetical protein
MAVDLKRQKERPSVMPVGLGHPQEEGPMFLRINKLQIELPEPGEADANAATASNVRT